MDAVKALLAAGANPNCYDYTPPAKVGRGWDADYFPYSMTSVLAMAVRSKDAQVVRALLDAGADPTEGKRTGSSSFEDGCNRRDTADHSESPMDIALRMGLKEVARELMGDKAAALSASTNLPGDLVESIMDEQIATMQPAPRPEVRVYNQLNR